MGSSLFLSVSVTVGFVSGVVALFAPCCLTILLPTYLAQIVQNKFKIILATLIFSLGIATVMLPVALGFRFIVNLFNNYHPYFYLVSSLIMILAGLLIIWQFKLPMWVSPRKLGKTTAFSSLYLLGITSGLASACCAPVLLGAITLASSVPSFLLALLVSVSYVLGMVTPLLIGSLLASGNWLITIRQGLNMSVGKTTWGNLLGGIVMIGYGLYLYIITSAGKLNQLNESPGYLRISTLIGRNISKNLNQNPATAALALLILVTLLVIIGRQLTIEIKDSSK